MGSAMGCCGKSEEDPNNLNTLNFGRDYMNADKLRLIIKIQSQFRGFLARKRVKEIR